MFKWIKDAKKLPQAIRDREVAERREHEANRIAATAQQNLQVARAKIAELEDKIRKQNEADLLMVSMQIVAKLTAGEKKDTPVMLSLLQQQSSAVQNVYPYGIDASYLGSMQALGNAFSGLGFGQGPQRR